MARIMADPAKMESFAKRVDTAAADFQTNYKQMYNVIDNLKSAWTGRDNQEYANKINEYKGDFDAMFKAIESYKDFLNQSAAAYRKAQDEIFNAAGQL